LKIVIFGLTISSSWGNGHATIWRSLCSSLARRGHEIVFYEKDVPYYAENRDMLNPDGVQLRLYKHWEEARKNSLTDVQRADVAIVTSYCPDGIAASEHVLANSRGLRVFYDLDTPVTLDALSRGERVPYIGKNGFADFDLVLSFTGGAALAEMRNRLGAKKAAPLYGSVDPEVHRPVDVPQMCRVDFSYLGTYAPDRQEALEKLFVRTAQRLPRKTFLIGGSLYPRDFPWTRNIFYIQHIAPPEHSRFYCASRLTLNVTRGAMARMGYCPSGRLFEAAACGAPILSDNWEGLEYFFEPGKEILLAADTEDAIGAVQKSAAELNAISAAAKDRVMREHTAGCRAAQFEAIMNGRLDPCGG
jgi:spore maturation protein CgeB